MVEREIHKRFSQCGEINAVKLVRGAAGGWSVHLVLDVAYQLPDGRQVIVKRHIGVRATEQIGRKRNG